MSETTSLWLAQSIITVLSNLRTFLITAASMIAALYMAELMIVGKSNASIKATLIIALAYSLISEALALFLSPVPLLLAIVQGISLAFLIQYYYKTDWLAILAVAIIAGFVIITILGVSLAFLEDPYH